MSLRVFRTVAELRSFTAAAKRLGLSPAMVSKHVMHLERRLATRLLNRTSRHVSLTEAGLLYLDQARQMLDGLDEVEAAVSRTTVTPRGTLRLSAPVWIADPVFAGLLADYRARYPEVRLDVDLSGRMVNLVEEGIDLALRATASPDPGLIARRLADITFRLVAAPSHLDRTGRPKAVADLDGRALLSNSLHWPDGSVTLDGLDGHRTVRFDPVLLSVNETLLHLAALEGMGLAFLPEWMIRQDLAEGRLESVLHGALALHGCLFGVYSSRKYLSAKVRTFLDFLAHDHRLR
ncbi:MAG TPA: LysR family transcriptional regulator [Geminicoccus sp.]|nr:LysR family transcriptional regulator [Geminicoccus sp.]HEX2526630.1 LysR family transcriptional regulator [Geminicoccus sp.]